MKFFLVDESDIHLLRGFPDDQPVNTLPQKYLVRYEHLKGRVNSCDQTFTLHKECAALTRMLDDRKSHQKKTHQQRKILASQMALIVGVSEMENGTLQGFVKLHARYPGNILQRLGGLSNGEVKAQVLLKFPGCSLLRRDMDLINEESSSYYFKDSSVLFPRLTSVAEWNSEAFNITAISILVTFPDLVLSETPKEVTPQLVPKLESMNITTQKILESETLSDVILVTSDGAEIKAHKLFLAARSSVFLSMFESDMKEARESRVETPDMEEKGVRALLKYLYSNDTTEAYENCGLAFELFNAGHKYDIAPLETEMKELLLTKPNDWYNGDVGVKLFLFARNLTPTDEQLKVKAVQVVKRWSDSLEESETYQELFEKDKKAAMELCRYSFKT